jgi:hypothetical protein
MPDKNVTAATVDELVRDLGADDPAVRERAQRELTRRSLTQVSVTDQLTAALTTERDAEVVARLRNILRACRFYIRAKSAVPSADAWWQHNVEFSFGTGPGNVEVKTPEYGLTSGLITPFGPTGTQIYNSAQHGLVLDCGDQARHEIYMEAADVGHTYWPFKFPCDGKTHTRYLAAFGHFWSGFRRRSVVVTVECEIQTVCGASLPP